MADKIVFKTSSILGKRPTNQNIQVGELALNTNSVDPGAFFEVSNGDIVKIGPTAVSAVPPTDFPEKGESWFDTGSGVLKIGSAEEAKRIWKTIAAPFLGGSGNCVFVAPEFEYSTDSIQNNGQALPFRTLTRAILELSKLYISNVLGGYSKSGESNRYTIFIGPSLTVAFNDPGKTLEDFSVDFSSDPDKEVTFGDLVQFNSPTGGIILPAGITIAGMDLKKSLLSPSYVPSYQNPVYENPGINEPLTSILKCSGNSYITNFSVIDKISLSEVVSVSQERTYAVFHCKRPHGLRFNELVTVSLNSSIDQSTGTFVAGAYYAIPIDTFSFYLSSGSQLLENSEPYVLYSAIPVLNNVYGPKFTISLSLKSAHRLSLARNIGLSELGDYYTKVQRAFSDYFGGQITNGADIVNSGDYVIVGPTETPYPENLASNTIKNSSFYANQVNLRSEYGMCWGDFDGSIVDGFRSVIANACTAVTLQNDPCVYEIYTTLINESGVSEQKWWNLTKALFLSLPIEERPPLLSLVESEPQLALLNSTPINNIRYYYQNLVEEVQGEDVNIGIVDIENDFRHFGFRTRNSAYAQLQSIYTIGAAIGVWALNGGSCNLTNSTSNFGSVSFKAEGFFGINSIGGANPNGKGFVFEGIQRPLALTRSQTESNENKKIFSLGSKISSVYLDPLDPFTQIIELSADFSPSFLLPYSLNPGSALWVETEDCTYRGFFATDGGPTVITGLDDPVRFAKLRIRASDSTIPNDNQLIPALGVPYIRRFRDPRQEFERAYSFFISNTSPTAVAPLVGDVLRLNQTSQQLGSESIRPNVQFDPGLLGGWGRIFTVDAVETGRLGSSPQFNYVLADTNQDLSYFVALTVSDYSRPWTQGPVAGGYKFKSPYGAYVTHKNRNWYTAENNLWDYVYYGDTTSFDSDFGPYAIAPYQSFSPFVDSSVLERQDSVETTFQGSYGPDPYRDLYLDGTYFRGATSPYPSYSTQDYYDGDDSSESLGICLTDVPDGSSTYLVADSVVIQEEEQALLASETGGPQRYRPAIIQFSVLTPVGIANPKQKVSVVMLSYEDPQTSQVYNGYVRVTNLNGSIVTGILLTFQNSSYLSYLPPGGGTNFVWPAGSTQVTVCSTNPIPESEIYDPYWTNTKRAVYRFFEIMGYGNNVMYPFLEPKFWGERLLSISSLNNILPANGYALVTDKWPLEFNEPSSIIANTHTWAYAGYYNYSRGLLQFQSTDITRKLASDFQAYTLWSGRLTVTGINDKGEIVLFGPQRQALTGNYYDPITPVVNLGNQQIYEEQPYVEFPSQVIVYSVDNISDMFDGFRNTFDLTRGGFAIPASQLNSYSMLVIVGAVIQKPEVDYIISGNRIQFTTSPSTGTYCDIRIVTSADEQNTLIAVPITLSEPLDGVRTVFNAYFEKDGTRVDLTEYDIDSHNTFLILGGVEQIPFSLNNSYADSWAYTIEKDPADSTNLIVTFNGIPPENTTVDMRSICTSLYWGTRNIFPVAVYSLDSISGEFDGAKTTFDLTFEGNPVNAATVTQDNLIFSLGGAIQIPGVSYEVQGSRIILLDNADAPRPDTSSNIRVISNAEFITCPGQGKYGANFVEWGPKLVLTLKEQVKNLEIQN